MTSFYEKVYYVVRRIPAGKVTSYGRIAEMLSAPRAARAVGYALNALGDKKGDPAYADVPWQRVINSQGRISIVSREASAARQAELLRAEGVAVSDDYQIDLKKYLWAGLHWSEVEHLWD
ncbi:MAG: MGMT family protein [Ardenticatenales bacterium]|nr:MGMT family protein [Ardenticatenales bacterium]